MPGAKDQHLRALYILKILQEHTDEQHPMSAGDIIRKLQEDYQVLCERKSLYRHINSLIYNFDVDIIYSDHIPRGYYIASRQFEMTELRLLIDAVKSSHFISLNKSKQLIEKLCDLAGPYQAKELAKTVRLLGVNKTDNELLYYTMDKIYSAMDSRRRITFRYFDYGPDKRRHYRNNGEPYVVSPYALVWDDERYYLHAYHEKYDHISSFRIDMMEGVEVSDLLRLKENEYADYDPAARSSFDQFTGKRTMVEMIVHQSLCSVMIDRFGEKVSMRKHDADHVVVRAEVEISPAFFSWVFAFGDRVRISMPQAVCDQMKDRLATTLQQYTTEKPL